ncbi:MAG: plasmid recombination protein, partial [Acidobacteria bacterium]|nr:plasmid recombination protein [Acidobacteriota bacterium]
MPYAIARVGKLKGPSVVSSGKHVDRERETPNADPDRRHENRTLVGDGRSLREVVAEKIGAHGGKPRRDSVECVEMLFSASPEFFFDEEEVIDEEKVSKFSEKTVEFLREKYGDRCVKAILHMDEHTPHIHAFMVPIDGRGRLNCKSFFGTRDKFRQFQTEYARKMEPIGLERGVEYSRARHTDVQRFYATIMEPVHIKVNHEHIPD